LEDIDEIHGGDEIHGIHGIDEIVDVGMAHWVRDRNDIH